MEECISIRACRKDESCLPLIVDDPSSHCFGSIRDGVFDGQIHTREGAYYVERVQKYSATSNDLIQRAAAEKQQPRHKSNATAMPPPHSVIYHEKDISDPYKHRRNGA